MSDTSAPPPRDWLGHGLQLLGILVIFGLPMLYWGSGVNTSIATLSTNTTRNERDISDVRGGQVIVSNQLADVNKQLTRIDTQISDFLRDQLRPAGPARR